ncbi:MAG: YbhB/YbcL family Raf kinase inhibitor-like protein [Desulfobacteraceae bacterium]|nr:YbhB/YbcL family Raf kinase inhibitor-like protein [Desulfobacteraceae bacterium]
MRLFSPAFVNEGMIPAKYTCDGPDLSPPLAWEGVPSKAKSLALICDDPDAPMRIWVHWIYYNIPATSAGLPEGIPADQIPEIGGAQGMNDFRRMGYGGPCPPSGIHRYFFKLYALDTVLDLSAGGSKPQLLDRMKGHILEHAQLMGTYQR